jgi:hypothetical protein
VAPSKYLNLVTKLFYVIVSCGDRHLKSQVFIVAVCKHDAKHIMFISMFRSYAHKNLCFFRLPEQPGNQFVTHDPYSLSHDALHTAKHALHKYHRAATTLSLWEPSCFLPDVLKSSLLLFFNPVRLRQTLKIREIYEGVTKSFRTGRLERELQMVQLSATK